MGMAASQSRFLALTARKSNTEYQGQQVNQQRTVLSNESSNLYNQLLTLEVPTPPSSNLYYESTYTYKTGGVNYSFSSDDIDYIKNTITVSHNNVNSTVFKTGASVAVKNLMGAGSLDKDATTGTYSGTLYFDDGTAKLSRVSSPSAELKTAAENDDNSKWRSAAKENQIYSYKVDDKEYYLNQAQLDALYEEINGEEPNGDFHANAVQVVNGTTVEQEVIDLADDAFEYSDTGRLSKIRLKNGDEISLAFTKVDNERAYDDAMNEYEYKKSLYDKKVEDINAKTESIQAKDKNLELKLKQLDTEQSAIQTEMEAVQKVIDKNVEDTFKTFA